MARKSKKEVVVKNARPIKRGHQNHRSGAGTHADRRTARMKTRGNQNKQAINEYFYF
jgi:hypothetical protein